MIIDYIAQPCMICGISETLMLDEEKLILWHNGAFIQDVFPDLTPAERELIKTGTHESCFDSLFEGLD